MPCSVEEDKGTYSWYCCRCAYGPYTFSGYDACISCNDHIFCGKPPSRLFGPLTSATRPLKGDTSSRGSVTPKPAIRTSASNAGVPSSRSRNGQSVEDAVLENNVTSVLNRRFDDPRRIDIVGTEEIAPFALAAAAATAQNAASPGIDYCPPHRDLPVYQRSRNSSSGYVAPSEVFEAEQPLVAHTGQRSESHDHPSTCPLTPEIRDRDRDEKILFACPFFKNNPHRWIHSLSCRQAHTLSRLRQHLTRSDGPHVLHECAKCSEAFPDEHALLSHERSYICNALPQCYPAEGVGQRLFAQIKEQNRGPRPKTYVADSVKVWQNWYTALFGLGVSVPSYKLEETDFTHCNDPNFQDDYRKRLKLTFSRPLPLGHKARALADHMKSQQHVELQILKELIGKEVIEQADAARHQPPSATKRKAGVTKGGQRPQASRRRTSTMSSSSEFAKATPEVYHLGPSRHDMMHNHVFDFVNDGLEDRPCLDLFHQSAIDTSLATTLAGFPAHALGTTSHQLGHESEIYDSFCGSQQLTFPYADWTASTSRLDNTFLPEMTDTSNTLPQFNLDAFSIDAQPPIQREDTDFTGEHSKERCKVTLPSAADRIAHLPIHPNSLFQNFVPVDTEF